MFRVGYEPEHRLALADRLSELTPLERSNLLADTWATTLAAPSPGISSSGRWRLGARARPGAVGGGRRALRLTIASLAPGPCGAAPGGLRLSAPSNAIWGSTRPGEGDRTRCSALWPSALWECGRGPRRPSRGGAPFDAYRSAEARRAHPRRGPGRHPRPWWRSSSVPATTTPYPGATATPPPRKKRCARSIPFLLPRRRHVPADLRPCHDRGAQPERVHRHRALFANPVGNQAVWTRVTEVVGCHPRTVPEDPAARIVQASPHCAPMRHLPSRGRHPCTTIPFVGTPPCRPVGGAPARQRRLRFPRACPSGHSCARRPGDRQMPQAPPTGAGPSVPPSRGQVGPPDPGFMPDDEGEAPYRGRTASRTRRSCRRHTDDLSRDRCRVGKSMVYLGAAAEATGRSCSPSTTTGARRRIRPVGITTSPTWSTRCGPDRHLAALAPSD